MSELAAYLDDSGTHQGSPIVVVAGAIASVSQWARLSKQWKKQLDCWNLPFFHTTDFVSGYGHYKGWDEPRKRSAVSALVRIIRANVRFLVGNAVRVDDFANAFAKYPNRCIKTPYHFCAVLSIPATGYWKLRSAKRGPVALIFESGKPNENRSPDLDSSTCQQDGRRVTQCCHDGTGHQPEVERLDFSSRPANIWLHEPAKNNAVLG